MAREPENRVLTLLRDIRAELGEHRGLLLALADQGRRTERRVDATERRMGDWEHRFAELRDDIELMLKATLMGRFGNFETRFERYIDDLADRVIALDARLPATP